MENTLSWLDAFWNNLIFTKDAKGFSLRAHAKDEKGSGWFYMTILASNCISKQEAIDQAIVFTKEI